MSDPRYDAMARLLVERMLAVRAGQVVAVDGPTLAAPLLERVVARIHAARARASVRVEVDGLTRELLRHSTLEALSAPDRLLAAEAEQADALLRVHGAWNTADLADIAPERLTARLRAREQALEVRFRRATAGALRWAVTIFPTAAHARQAGLARAELEELVFRAAKLDARDPILAWERQAAWQEGLCSLLERRRTLRIVADGTDLTLSVAGRRWRSSAANRNLPDGEVFSGPVEDSAEGVVRFSYPIVRAGRRIEDVRLRFQRGVVVEAEARVGGDALRALLDVDEGARRLGEVGIGTNLAIDRFTGQALLDEKIGGTVHLALGRGYPETGSGNVSAEHWDLICDLRAGGRLRADDETILEDGRFRLPEAPR